MRNLIVWGLIIGLGAAVNFFTDSRRSDTGEVIAAGSESVFDLRIGDCIRESMGDEQIESTTVVPCAEAHDYVVYAKFELPADSYPGPDKVFELAGDGCYDRFGGYFQIAYEDSALDITTLSPTQEGWKSYDDRSVSCLGYKVDGQPMVGEVRGI